MPTSYTDFKIDIQKYINRKFNENIKILDIGPGEGTYAKLLSNYKNIDCVEIYEPYVEQFKLKDLYRNVNVSNILDFDFEYYDLIIMGDILEHLTVEDSKKLLKRLLNKCEEIIISVPYLADFNYLYDNEPNKAEIHIQTDLTKDVMFDRYPNLKMLWSNHRIGIYCKNTYRYNPSKSLAITTYIDNNDLMINEFEWLYKSYIYSGNYVNSDVIAFCHPSVINKLDINILNDKNVVIIPLLPISSLDPFWSNYPFINSLYYLRTKESEIVKNYDYILRTDNDVFLTKNLINLRSNFTYFGQGGFMKTINAQNKIIEILNKLKLKYQFIHNVGSTILGKKDVVFWFNNNQFIMSHYIKNNYFIDNKGEWPDWYYGVISMYAGDVVANQMDNSSIRINLLDSYSMSDYEISNDIYHIHAWHTQQYFSKHKYREGEYNHIDVDNIDIKLINNYCLYIAKKSIEDIKKVSNY